LRMERSRDMRRWSHAVLGGSLDRSVRLCTRAERELYEQRHHRLGPLARPCNGPVHRASRLHSCVLTDGLVLTKPRSLETPSRMCCLSLQTSACSLLMPSSPSPSDRYYRLDGIARQIDERWVSFPPPTTDNTDWDGTEIQRGWGRSS
jgi:hypothetical protein